MSSTTDAAVGAHVAPERPLDAAAELGADCVQIFLSDPQGWQKPDARADAAELRESPLPLYVHAPYLINVCSPRNNVRYGSRDPAGTGADRHANLGKGEIDVEALRAMVRAAGPPAVVETPGDLDDLRADVEFVRAALAA